MNSLQKIKIQQEVILSQKQKIDELESKIQNLEETLEIEKNTPKQGYQEAKNLIEELNGYMAIYKDAIYHLKESKRFYDKNSKELLKHKELSQFLKKIENCL